NYTGLFTDPLKVQQFIKDNDAIEKIVIDRFPYICDATLSSFNSRETPRQRSKTLIQLG
ncbi:hypothetical protein BD770DRAFT_327825, partial [Pilaira anomala]